MSIAESTTVYRCDLCGAQSTDKEGWRPALPSTESALPTASVAFTYAGNFSTARYDYCGGCVESVDLAIEHVKELRRALAPRRIT